MTLSVTQVGLAAARLDPSDERFPNVSLPAAVRGEAAIQALGNQLPSVAAAYGWNEERLLGLLRQERTLNVDHKGRLFYADDPLPAPPHGAVEGAAGVLPAGGTIPLADTFKLHSRAGSKRVIYLDFDGHTLSGTIWNTYNGGRDIVAPAWDIEGGSSVFTDNERSIIQQIWARVKEDFAPFEVDVTTESPGESALTRSSSSDEFYGTRVLISPISSYIGNYGGYAYIGVFDAVGDYYKTALVFPENLMNNAKYVGEACSHETGHSLGLNHDGVSGGTEYYGGHGSGETGWAPIMGSGYYQNLTQWSKGEYPGANNTQDDLAVIQSYGLAYQTDDHGNTLTAATYLGPGSSLLGSGLISQNADKDVWSFVTQAGTVTLNVAPVDDVPNLDVLAQLYSSSGSLLASSNPADSVSSGVSLAVPGGTYYLIIQGTGKGDLATGFSKYASLGEYTFTATVADPSGLVAPAAVASATPTSGSVPLVVQFNSSQSFDIDGTIVGWAWNFGDGTSSSEPNPSHTFYAAGNYTVTLTLTDNDGYTGNTSVAISVVSPNALPIARIVASPQTGYTPLTVTLDGSGSTDPDGTITAWNWTFGDGTSGSGTTVQHVYAAAGDYPVVLTVTDSRGAISTAQTTVQVTQDPNKVLRVAALTLTVTSSSGGKAARAAVRVTDTNGNPISGVSVAGQWSGAVTGTGSGTTDASGLVAITSKRFKRGGTVTFAISNVSKSGFVYQPTQNLVTQSSVAAGVTP